ncbi:hypothetical protein ONZ45_g19583 [Pleurotus djamor]|nr:hypothetical protein ONZ45_g19583 [Pleurotus djamor]
MPKDHMSDAVDIHLANYPKALHLIAYPYDPLNVKVYQVDTHKLETCRIHHNACVVEGYPYALNPPPAILHSEDSPKQLAEQMRAVDLDTLVPVPRRALLYHLYPIGLPWGIHLVNNRDCYMVVTDDLSAAYKALDNLANRVKLFTQQEEGIKEKLRNRLQNLHGGGYVHGDVCFVDVLVQKTWMDEATPLA